MNLKDAFAGIKEAQELKRPGAQAPRRSKSEAPKVPLSPSARSTPGTPLPLQGTAKSRHPEFEAVKIYVRKETRKRAWRKWEDAGGGDFSDLVEMLLEKYLGA